MQYLPAGAIADENQGEDLTLRISKGSFNMKKALTTLALASLLVGCATPPIVNYSIADVRPVKQPLDADMRSLVIHITPDAKLENIQTPGMLSSREGEILFNWQNSLQDSLNKGGFFIDSSSRKINIIINITLMKRTNGAPFTPMTADIEARYDIVERDTNKLIASKTIASSGVTEYSESANNIYRVNEAMSRAVKFNIVNFLDFLRNGFENK